MVIMFLSYLVFFVAVAFADSSKITGDAQYPIVHLGAAGTYMGVLQNNGT